MNITFENPWIWLIVAVIALWLCTYLPLRIRDERKRKLIYRLVLVPISLLLILYTYPMGIEVFRRLGNSF